MATTKDLLAKYGNPDGGGHMSSVWYNNNVIDVVLPYRMRIAWSPEDSVTKIKFHKLGAANLTKALTAVYAAAREFTKKSYGFSHTTEFYDAKTLEFLQKRGLDLFGGSLCFRVIRGKTVTLSRHSWAVAIDINPAKNQQGRLGNMPDWFVKCFEDAGFVWGGRWSGKTKDPMHFELA